ncbi:MAG: hypothetical protein M3Y48_09760 [Actinomycetota bacterium]|nr:hypothetical protein [Actinomycetota bacterium]
MRHGVTELQAIGLVFEGSVLIYRGQVARGLALLDEGMAMAVSGELSPGATVTIFCMTIASCDDLGDYRRANEWTEAIEDCFARTGLTGFPGDSETHRIGIMISRGAWALAEQLAHRACAGTQCIDLAHAGVAFAGSVISGCEWATSPAPRRPSSRPRNWGPARCPDGPGWSCCSAAPLRQPR